MNKIQSVNPLVYIILVNYKGFEDTVECVKSLDNINYDNYKIIIVENSSGDEEKLKNSAFLNSRATIMYSDMNGGFSAGNNIGINKAMEESAEYVLLLNNDTVVDRELLNELVSTAQNNPKAGIITGDIYYFSQKERLWYSAGSYDRAKGKTIMVNETNSPCEVSFVCGCLMLIRAEVIKNIGVLSDDFFLYSEDTEYGCRVLKAGYTLMWNRKAIIWHKISVSTGENSPFQQYYQVRNNLYMTRLYGTRKLYAYMYRTYQCLKSVIKKELSYKAVWRAYKDFLLNRMGKRE